MSMFAGKIGLCIKKNNKKDYKCICKPNSVLFYCAYLSNWTEDYNLQMSSF